MNVIIAGDLVPTKSNINKFMDKNFINYVDKDFQEIWKCADFRMFNLECPLGENYNPIDKNGPNLIAPSNTIYGIKSLNPSCVFLSNNHILDYGEKALDNTINLLKRENINYIGIIKNNTTESEVYYIEKDNVKIGIYNLCENEFSAATENSKGANAFQGIKNYKEIKKAKDNCDFLIVIFHGGKELYRYPSPNLQNVCRNFVDFGANLVITQHSHCIGCKEEYNNAQIIYGQGNFIFDKVDNEYWNTSLLIKLEINNKKEFNISYIPIQRNKGLITISNNQNIINDFINRSEQIKEKKFIETKYDELAMKYLNSYLNIMNKVRFITRIINKIFKKKYFEKTYTKKDCLKILNMIECEAHRELFIRGLKLKIKN